MFGGQNILGEDVKKWALTYVGRVAFASDMGGGGVNAFICGVL